MASRVIELDPGRLVYCENFVEQPASLFEYLRLSADWQQPELSIFGRRLKTRRLVSFVGDPGIRYRYSGHSHEADAWPEPLGALNDRLRQDYGLWFNCALLNYYRGGSEAMGYHSDDEPELGESPVIASISLGAERDFVLRRKADPRQKCSLVLQAGSLLLMMPPCQRHWQHALPARKRIGEGRINITFRRILPR